MLFNFAIFIIFNILFHFVLSNVTIGSGFSLVAIIKEKIKKTGKKNMP